MAKNMAKDIVTTPSCKVLGSRPCQEGVYNDEMASWIIEGFRVLTA